MKLSSLVKEGAIVPQLAAKERDDAITELLDALIADGTVDAGLRDERLAELRELQDDITAQKRDELIGRRVEVLVDEPGVGRPHREAPEIDGIVSVPQTLPVGEFATVEITSAMGPDLEAEGPVPAVHRG